MITFIVILSILQFVIGLVGLVCYSLDFKKAKGSLESATHERKVMETQKKRDGYSSHYPIYEAPDYYKNRMGIYSKQSRKFGLVAATAPFCVVLVPLAIVGAVGYGLMQVARAGIRSVRQGIVPALTYKGE